MNIILCLGIEAQPVRILFDSYRLKDGLSNDQVFAIEKDKNGFLWVGTKYGLNRFDGKYFKNFYNNSKDSNSIRDNIIMELYVDRKNQLWIGTRTGVDILDLENYKFKHLHFPQNENRTIRNNEILEIWQDPCSNRIFIGSNKGLFYSDGESNDLIAFPDHSKDKHLHNLSIRSICLDRKNRLWLGTNFGLLCYSFIDSTYKHIYTEINNKESFTDNNVQDVYEDREGNLWVATWGSGIRKYNEIKNTFEDYLNDSAQFKTPIANISLQIAETNIKGEEDLLWIASDNPGFSCFNKTTKKFERYFTLWQDTRYLMLGHSRCLYYDLKDGLWIGGQYGLWQYNPKKQFFDIVNLATTLNPKALNQITDTYVDPLDSSNQTIFFSTWNNSAYEYNFQSKSLEDINKKYNLSIIPESYIYKIERDKNNELLVATDRNGLIQCNTNRKPYVSKLILKNENVSCFYIDSSNAIWAGTENNLFFITPDRSRSEKIILIPKDKESVWSNQVKSICPDRNGNIWISLGNDADLLPVIVCHNISSKKNRYYYNSVDPNSLPIKDEIRNLVCDTHNRMYCASRKGMVTWIADSISPSFRLFTIKDGLCNDFINEIAIDEKDQVWCATLQGLSVYSYAKNTFINYYAKSGLLDNEIRSISYSGNRLFINFWGLLNICDPTQTSMNKDLPLQEISEFRVNNKIYLINNKFIEFGDHVTLQNNQNSIEIDLAALSYTNPDLVTVSYFMEGFDKFWHTGNLRNVSYKLDFGNYVFRFKSCNSDGYCTPTESKLYIHIKAPFWKTSWFFALLSFSAISLFYIYFKLKENQRIRLEKIRMAIARDLHDDIGSNLSNIKLISEMASLKTDTLDKSTYLKISEKTSQVMEYMSDIVWSINPKNDEMTNIIPWIQKYAIQTLEPLDINLKFELEDLPNHLELDLEKRRNLFLICKEAFNNISKYSQANNVLFKVQYNQKQIHITIQDDGKGFDLQANTFGNGLQNMKDRAKQLGGELLISSTMDHGTKIDLWFAV